MRGDLEISICISLVALAVAGAGPIAAPIAAPIEQVNRTQNKKARIYSPRLFNIIQHSAVGCIKDALKKKFYSSPHLDGKRKRCENAFKNKSDTQLTARGHKNNEKQLLPP